MEAAGFTLADYEFERVEVWPENWDAWQLFLEMRTQWRIGPCGPVGLDYTVLFRMLDNRRLSPEAWQDLFDDMQCMESWALDAMLASRNT